MTGSLSFENKNVKKAIFIFNNQYMTPNIHEKLKLLRLQKKMSQLEVAEALLMSQNAYSLLETGKTKLDIERLYRIAEFYSININDFFTPPPIIKYISVGLGLNKFYNYLIMLIKDFSTFYILKRL